MKQLKTIVTVSAGAVMFAANITPVFANDINTFDPIKVRQVCENQIEDLGSFIRQTVDNISIDTQESVTEPVFKTEVSNEPVTYTYVEQESYEQTMTADEFMALYGSMIQEPETISETATTSADISTEEAAYQEALSKYNSALAEYEAASQMIETTKEVEVEIIEEVTDEEGNVTEAVRTEVQTVTEMVPAGDIVEAQANLDAAKDALDSAKQTLETAEVNFAGVETTETIINEEIVTREETTYSSSGTCGDDLTWTLDDNGLLVISGTGPMNNYIFPVSPGWGKEIQSVEIQNGVTTIGNRAFDSCTNLTSVTIPESITTIGQYAFNKCTGLTDITIPNGVTYIDINAFNGAGLTSITIPDSVTDFGRDAFINTPFINDYEGDFIVLGNGILYKYVGKDTEVIIPDNVNMIGSNAFNDCTALVSVTIPENVTKIGASAFNHCTSLTSITLPNTITSIEDDTFSYCSSLTDISIPDSVTTIGSHSFYGCTGLRNIVIPDSVNSIGSYTFFNSGLTSVTIPEGITSIGIHMFNGCANLTSVSISNSVTSIESYAFYQCTALTDITIPEGVTRIGEYAFNNSGLTNVVIPESLTDLGINVFDGTPFINALSGDYIILRDDILYKYKGEQTSLTLPNTVRYIAGNAFPSNITDVEIPESVEIIGASAFVNSKLTTIDLPNTIIKIGSNAFNSCRNLTKITLPKDLTEISQGLFSQCSSLMECEIPESVTSIGNNAFFMCNSLSTVNIPDNVTSIGDNAFYRCSGLTSLTISDSVTSIGNNAFMGCSSLTDVYYEGTEKEWIEKNLYKFDQGVTIHFLGLPFEDVPKDAWYYSVAKECYVTGLINGTSETTFSPMQEMTRAMVITILWRMEGQPKTEFSDKFKDVNSDQWYATSISWAEQAGVVHGYGDGTFKPDAAVTREQVAVMLANYATYKGVYVPGTKKLNTYPDGSQVSTWAQAGMKWAITNGIISGNGEGYLRPKKSATRAEGAAMLLRMKNWL